MVQRRKRELASAKGLNEKDNIFMNEITNYIQYNPFVFSGGPAPETRAGQRQGRHGERPALSRSADAFFRASQSQSSDMIRYVVFDIGSVFGEGRVGRGQRTSGEREGRGAERGRERERE